MINPWRQPCPRCGRKECGWHTPTQPCDFAMAQKCEPAGDLAPPEPALVPRVDKPHTSEMLNPLFLGWAGALFVLGPTLLLALLALLALILWSLT